MSQKFNLDDYETVKSRKKRFYAKFPEGRIIAEAVSATADAALFKATLFRNPDEQAKGLPLATGFAQEFKGKGGFANNFSWCENCEESAIGRALDNAGFAGNDKCSREEIAKVERHQNALPAAKAQAVEVAMQDNFTSAERQLFKTEEDVGKKAITFGKKYRGKRFEQIPPDEIKMFCQWLESAAEAKGEKLHGPALEFLEDAYRYMHQVGVV